MPAPYDRNMFVTKRLIDRCLLKLVLLAEIMLAWLQVQRELHGCAKQIRVSHSYGSSVN